MSFNEWLNKHKYWLIGGCIGAFVNILLTFLSTGIAASLGSRLEYIINWVYWEFPLIVMTSFIKCGGEQCIGNMYLAAFTGAIILGFVVGGLLGFIIKLVRTKK